MILNEHPPTYLQELSDELLATVMASSEAGLLDRPGGIFIRRADLLKPEEITLLNSLARIQVDCDGLGLGNFLERDAESVRPRAQRGVEENDTPQVRSPVPAPVVAAAASVAPVVSRDTASTHGTSLSFFNGLGGFNDKHEYVIQLDGDTLPPAPWVNVIGNPSAGFIASETGTAATWAENSYFFRLTPWTNDPVMNPACECIYLRDESSGDIWTATPEPVRHKTPYTVRHGAGYSIYEHEHDGLTTALRVGMPESDPVKLQVLSITNTGSSTRRLAITSYAEWVLGVTREQTQEYVRTEMAADGQMMLARNYFDPLFAKRVAFTTMSERVTAFTAARREFIGRNGELSAPAALLRRGLTGDIGDTLDSCAALQSVIDVPAGETREIVILLGAAESQDEALALHERYGKPSSANAAMDHAARVWRARLGTISVRTPEPTLDLVLNQWALYQALSCRMWARSAVYQSSGAFGFRDQLQDVMAFVYSEPQLAREHIIRCAARQFEEGDVQHWWHPQSGRGVRTRFSDDLVWLAYVVNHYIDLTDDRSILDATAPYLKMRLLDADEHEIYDLPQVSELTETVYDHCVRALRKACTVGEHGLPLIGIGDWNDGMNRVGVHGKGESVWLAWFLIATLRDFAEIAEERGDSATGEELLRTADKYNGAVEAEGWDGAWYRRAYYDDGAPLGSKDSDECRIDSIAQSWSVISRAGNAERSVLAMQSLVEHLVREDDRVIMLLTPPFDKGTHDPGYIKGYLPGVRENGAQYTHAALWAALAAALLGQGDQAMHLYQMINPVTHALTPEDVATYKVEPYVVAADVYTADGHVGRGGWTWYTGSASWLYRVGLEGILGFTKRGESLSMNPCIPSAWDGFYVEYRHGDSTYCIVVNNPSRVERGVQSVMLDGIPIEGPLPLVTDGSRHEVIVTLGPPTSPLPAE